MTIRDSHVLTLPDIQFSTLDSCSDLYFRFRLLRFGDPPGLLVYPPTHSTSRQYSPASSISCIVGSNTCSATNQPIARSYRYHIDTGRLYKELFLHVAILGLCIYTHTYEIFDAHLYDYDQEAMLKGRSRRRYRESRLRTPWDTGFVRI